MYFHMAITTRLYQALTDDNNPTCQAITKEACEVTPKNFIIILLAQFFTKLADAMASTKIVLPWLMSAIGVPAFMIGMLVPIRESGSLIPQVFLGGIVRRYKIRKWIFILGCLLQASIIGAIAFSAMALKGFTAGFVIIVLLLFFSVARGISSIASKDVLGKTIPKSRRGQLGGLSASAAGAVAIFVGIALFLELIKKDTSIAWLLVFASGFWFIASWVFSLITEFSGSRDKQSSLQDTLKRSLDLLRSDSTFRTFIIARCLLLSSALVAPYIVMLAQRQDSIDGGNSLALFIIVSGFASLISGRIWGKFCDSSSRKVMFVTSLGTCLLCLITCGTIILFTNAGAITFVSLFFILAILHQGARLGRKTYVVDIAEGNKRTDYVTISNTIVGIVLLIIGFLGAVTAQFSLSAVLGFYAITAMLATIVSYSLKEA